MAGKNLISNIIVNNLLYSNDSDPKIMHAHNLEKLGEFIHSILPDDSQGVLVETLMRISKRIDDTVEPQPYTSLR